MKDIVFIGWCGDRGIEYAKKLKNELEGSHSHTEGVIGGNITGEAKFLSIPDTIIDQMNSCCGAILLFGKNAEGKVSPNLLFEYGYLLNRFTYRNKRPLVVFMDIKEDEKDKYMPTDLQNCWTFFPTKDGDERFKEIVKTYYSDRKKISDLQINFFTKVEEIGSLIETFNKRRNISLYHFAYYLLYYLQTCYYSEDFSKLKKALECIDYCSPNYLIYVKKYCETSISYYELFYKARNEKVNIRDLYNILNIYKNLNKEVESINEEKHSEIKILLKYFIHEHIGFVTNIIIFVSKTKIKSEDDEYAVDIIRHANKALEWIKKHANVDNLEEMCLRNEEKDVFIDILFASHCANQLSGIYSKLYESTKDEKYHQLIVKYYKMTYVFRKYIQNNYERFLKHNAKANEVIKLDYHSTLAGLYNETSDVYEKNEIRNEIVDFLNKKEDQYEIYEDYVENIIKTIGYHKDHTAVVAFCGASGSGKTTLAETVYAKLKNDYKILDVIEDARENPYVGKTGNGDTFKSQIMFYAQNLKRFSNDVMNNYDLVIFDRNIDDHYLLSTYRYDLKQMNDDEYKVCTYLKDAIKPISPKIDLMFYVKCDFEEIKERFKKRHSSWDEGAEQYIVSMKKYYDEWINKLKEENEFKIIEIDTTNNLSDSDYEDIVLKIERLIISKKTNYK